MWSASPPASWIASSDATAWTPPRSRRTTQTSSAATSTEACSALASSSRARRRGSTRTRRPTRASSSAVLRRRPEAGCMGCAAGGRRDPRCTRWTVGGRPDRASVEGVAVLVVGSTVQARRPLLDLEARLACRTFDERGQRVVLRGQHAHAAGRTGEGDDALIPVATHLARSRGNIDGDALTHGADICRTGVVVTGVAAGAVDEHRRVERLEAALGAVVGTGEMTRSHAQMVAGGTLGHAAGRDYCGPATVCARSSRVRIRATGGSLPAVT